MKKPYRLIIFVIVLALASLACQFDSAIIPATPTNKPGPPPVLTEGQPYKITGTFNVTNDFVLKEYYIEHAVGLADMHGFVIRDQEWELPVDSQVLGFMKVNEDFLGGTFELSLPLKPLGEFNDVDNNGKKDTGVQIFAVAYWPNLTGGPFAEGDDRSRGWPSYLASIKTDAENKDEVIGGKLVIWAPDASQQFPAAFGTDGLLFTADDPVGPLPAGYSIVDLDTKPFTVSQTLEPQLTLLEPADVAKKDFSKLSMVDAFEKMFSIIRKEYAFSGIQGKQPDWDKLYVQLKPRVEQAQKDDNQQAYYEALRDFIFAFKDGHVSISGDLMINDFRTNYGSGYGFTIRELAGGKVIVNNVVSNGSAAKVGMKPGAEVTAFNSKPIGQAIGEVQPFFLQSSDYAIRFAQAIWLLRAREDAQAAITFTNPGGSSQTVKLIAKPEIDILFSELGWNDAETTYPVEAKVIKQNGQDIGYVRILSNSDDLNLIIRLFEHALKNFKEREVAGVIIDLRVNSGGSPLGLAGFLTDKEIIQGQLEYYSDKTGKFEPEGDPDKITPYQNQYQFDKVVLLVGQDCYSACELEADGFSKLPGIIIVGQTPSAGVEAETARGDFNMPAGIDLTIPTGRFTNPDGSIFLEGQGVQPTVRVPIDEKSILSGVDVVLQAGIDAILGGN